MNKNKSIPFKNIACFDAGLGANEQRTEPYTQYGEGVAQFATTPGTKNVVGALGSAQGWDNMSGGVYERKN